MTDFCKLNVAAGDLIIRRALVGLMLGETPLISWTDDILFWPSIIGYVMFNWFVFWDGVFDWINLLDGKTRQTQVFDFIVKLKQKLFNTFVLSEMDWKCKKNEYSFISTSYIISDIS